MGQPSVNTSVIDDETNKPSFLMNNLRRQLGELDVITERLKARYHSGSETSNSSVPPPPPPPPPLLDLPIQTMDSTRSTIQSDFLEQFPESLSGRPLISNGLNVTDVLSLHNDQVRLAQELMSKANHLLETSKDFFTKPSTPPPPPPVTVVSPPALPTFDRTSPSHHSIVSDDDDEHFLPIGLPPIQHRSLITTSTSPLLPMENPLEEIDVVHLRPLNNLSAFNFDCQQMNAAQPSPPPPPQLNTRRTIFSDDSSSPSPLPTIVQQSFSSDSSVIDRQWLEKQKERERIPSACSRQVK